MAQRFIPLSPFQDPASLGLTRTTTPGGGTAFTDGTNLYIQDSNGLQLRNDLITLPTTTPTSVSTSTSTSTNAPFIKLPDGQVASFEPNNTAGAGYYIHGQGSQSRLSLNDIQSGIPLDSNKNPISAKANAQSSSGDPTYDLLNNFLQKLQAQGLQINPNIDITNDSVAQLINQYYQTEGKIARDSFLKGLGYAQEDILRHEQQVERNYGINLRQFGESEAERGFAQSGERQLGEQRLAQATQEELDAARRGLGRSAESAASAFAQRFGTANLPVLNLPSAPRVIPGQPAFQREGSTIPFYSLSPDIYSGITGTEEFKRRSDIEARRSQLEGAQRTLQSLPSIRSISL